MVLSQGFLVHLVPRVIRWLKLLVVNPIARGLVCPVISPPELEHPLQVVGKAVRILSRGLFGILGSLLFRNLSSNTVASRLRSPIWENRSNPQWVAFP